MKKTQMIFGFVWVLAVMLAVLWSPVAMGAIMIKANNADNLNLGSSWTNGVPPTSVDIAQWDSGTTGAVNTVGLGADMSWQGIVIDSTHSVNNITITNTGHTLTLGSSGIVHMPNLAFGLYNPINLGAAQTWFTTVSIISTTNQVNTAGFTFTLDGVNSSSKQFKGPISGGGDIIVKGGIFKLSGSSARALSSSVTAYTDATVTFDTAAGALFIPRAPSVSLNSATLSVAGNSSTNSVDTIQNSLTLGAGNSPGGWNVVTVTPNANRNAQLVASSLVRTNNGVVVFSGTSLGAAPAANVANISFGTAPTGLIGGSGAAGTHNINILPWAVGNTTAAGGAASFVTYDVNGVRPLNVATEYDAVITDGASVNNNVMVANGSTNTINSGATINSLFMMNGATSVTAIDGSNTLTVTSGAVFIGGGGSGTPIISAALDFGSRQGVIGYIQGKNSTINGAIKGSGGVVFYQNTTLPILGSPGNGVTLGAGVTNSTYTGDTYVHARLALAGGMLPSGTRTGDLYLYGILEPSGNFTLNGLFGSGMMNTVYSGARTLTIGDNNANGNFSGPIYQNGALSVTKIGSGTLILSSTNSTFSGKTTVQNGILSVVSLNSTNLSTRAAGSSLGLPAVASGVIDLGASNTTGQLSYIGPGETTDRPLNLNGTTGGGTLDASGTGPLVFTSAITATGAGSKTLLLQGGNVGANEIRGSIANNNVSNRTSLVKAGTGVWTLSGTNTFTGSTTVSNGTLAINGGVVSAVTVCSNAVLSGAGWIATNGVALTVESGGVVDPGTVGGTGTLTVTGNVMFASGGKLRVDAGAGGADLLAVTGIVNAASSPVSVTVNATGEGPWVIMTAANITPSFVPDSPDYVLRNNGNSLTLYRGVRGTTLIIQ